MHSSTLIGSKFQELSRFSLDALGSCGHGKSPSLWPVRRWNACIAASSCTDWGASTCPAVSGNLQRRDNNCRSETPLSRAPSGRLAHHRTDPQAVGPRRYQTASLAFLPHFCICTSARWRSKIVAIRREPFDTIIMHIIDRYGSEVCRSRPFPRLNMSHRTI